MGHPTWLSSVSGHVQVMILTYDLTQHEKNPNQIRRVCLPNNYVFYVVLTHDFLHHRIKIQQPPAFFYLQPSSTSRQSQDHRSTDHKKYFFYARASDGRSSGHTRIGRAVLRLAGVLVLRGSRVGHAAEKPSSRPRRQLKRGRERKRKSIFFC